MIPALLSSAPPMHLRQPSGRSTVYATPVLLTPCSRSVAQSSPLKASVVPAAKPMAASQGEGAVAPFQLTGKKSCRTATLVSWTRPARWHQTSTKSAPGSPQPHYHFVTTGYQPHATACTNECAEVLKDKSLSHSTMALLRAPPLRLLPSSGPQPTTIAHYSISNAVRWTHSLGAARVSLSAASRDTVKPTPPSTH